MRMEKEMHIRKKTNTTTTKYVGKLDVKTL